MMRRLKTGAWSVLSFSSRESLTPLERVESLRVKDEQNKDGVVKSDTLLEDGSSPIFNVDYFQDARRQVYSESLIFRTTPFYAGKVRLEQRVDEHHLLRMHLAALERSERNGPLLLGDEYTGFDSHEFAGGSRDPLAAGGGPVGVGRSGGWTMHPTSYVGAVPSPTSGAAAGAVAAGAAARMTAALGGGGMGFRSGERATGLRYGALPAADDAASAAKEEGGGGAGGGAAAAGAEGATAAAAADGGAGRGREDGRRSSPGGPDAEAGSSSRGEPPGGGAGETTADGVEEKRRDWGDGGAGDTTEKRQAQQQRPSDAGRGRGREGERSAGVKTKHGSLSRGPSTAGTGAGRRGGLGGILTSRGTGSGRQGGPGGSATLVGGIPGDSSSYQRARWICDTGGEPHVLNWAEWLKRQRSRGWFTSETLYYMTIFGAVVGAGDLTTFWSQMQVWHSSMFFIPYLVAVFLIGLPALQLEILTGNLYRGAPVKCFTQLSPWFLGVGVLTFISNFLRITLIANRSGQLLIYFVASLSTPHPWQLTAKDVRTCMNYSGHKAQCEQAMHGTLCHYIDSENICMASPTGKATYYYLSQLQPYTLDPTTNPDALQGKMIGAMAFVWCYILAYIWRGLFKLGFLSAVLMFVAVVLCVTLIFVSFFMEKSGGAGDVTRVIMATFDFRQMIDSLGDSRLSAAIVDFALSDMTLGCGVFSTISSFTKIGYNVAPSGWYTTVVDFAMSTVAFSALLAVVGRIQTATGISVRDVVAKTGGAASYFVIFPAAFEKVSASNVFAMFFYGAIFVLNTQVAAIAIHCMINTLMESRGFRAEHHKVASVILVICSFVFCIPFCCANQQVRVDYFKYLVNSFVIPSVVLVHSLAFGWFHNVTIQIRLAGKKAFTLYSVLCTVSALVYCLVAGFFTKSFVTPLCYPLVWNTIFAIIIAATVKDPFAAPRFGSRFWALYIGNIESFRHEVCRQTLFNTRGTVPLVWCVKSLPRVFCRCMRSKPFVLCRPSFYWSFAIKHFVPASMLLLLVHGFINFSAQWQRMAPSPNLRGVGLTIVILSYVVSIAASCLPRRYTAWMCPPAEDYMPIQCFPYHPYKPPVYVEPRAAIVALFREFLRASYRPSFYLTPLLTEYRLHHVRQHQLAWEAAAAFRPNAAAAAASSRALLYSGAGIGRGLDGDLMGARGGKIGSGAGGGGGAAAALFEEEESDFDGAAQSRGVVRTTSVCSTAGVAKERRRHPLRIPTHLRHASPSLLRSSVDRRLRVPARRITMDTK